MHKNHHKAVWNTLVSTPKLEILESSVENYKIATINTASDSAFQKQWKGHEKTIFSKSCFHLFVIFSSLHLIIGPTFTSQCVQLGTIKPFVAINMFPRMCLTMTCEISTTQWYNLPTTPSQPAVNTCQTQQISLIQAFMVAECNVQFPSVNKSEG